MIVLGLSGLPLSQEHHLRSHPDLSPLDERVCQGLDSAAALVVDGRLVAAASEERFTGEKGTGRLPLRAIDFVLGEAGLRRRTSTSSRTASTTTASGAPSRSRGSTSTPC